MLYNALTYRHCAANEWARSLARFDSILFYFRTENMHTADNREVRRSNRLGPIIFDCARLQFIRQTFTYGDDALIVGFYYDLIKRGAFSRALFHSLCYQLCVNLDWPSVRDVERQCDCRLII